MSSIFLYPVTLCVHSLTLRPHRKGFLRITAVVERFQARAEAKILHSHPPTA